MPDKPTDSEIKQAVEKCIIHKKCKNCMFEDESGCSKRLLYLAYNLINRLQVENERLEAECEEQYESAEATIRTEIASGGTSCHWCENKVRIEAYKEFAERLKEWFRKESEVYKLIDNLLKELVGEDNAKEKE